MSLNAAAKEWKPPATSKTNPDVLLTSDFQLPPANTNTTRRNDGDDLEGDEDWYEQPTFDPHSAVYVYDEETGEGVLHEDGYVDGGENGGVGGHFAPSAYQQQQYRGPQQHQFAPPTAQRHHQQHFGEGDAALHALHQAVFGPPADANVDENGMPFLPELPKQDEDVDWDAALKMFLAAQRELVAEQVEEQRIRESGGATAAEQRHAAEFPQLPQADDSKSAAAFWAKGPTAIRQTTTSGHAAAATSSAASAAASQHRGGGVQLSSAAAGPYSSSGAGRPHASSSSSVAATSMASAPLTINGKHRWPKQTKAQQRQETVQKQAFEAFANALLHSTSPFMAPLRDLCKSSLPHLKLDQRFGKRGAPHTAVSQFVVAPIVVNYRPRHFHEVSPGDQMEYHYDLSQVLRRISTVNCIAVSYGPEWKPYAVPFCYLGCRDYKAEVLKLCPNEIPNSRSEAVYEDDIVKDITELVLAIEELQGPLRKWSLVQCMSKRVNLSSMYDAFEAIFAPVGNYQIQIRNLHSVPSQFLIKTSQQVLDLLPDKGHTGIVLHGDPDLWYELPDAANAFQSGKSAVVANSSSTIDEAHRGGGGATVVAAASTTPKQLPRQHLQQQDAVKPLSSSPPPIQQQQAAQVQQVFQSSGKGSTATSTEATADEGASSGNTTTDLVLYGVCAAAVVTTVVVVVRLLRTSP
ncbi:transmembrane protein, putative [Bodo saltans]|uniref:Transmembrane protein, putative n=1 Tax=Bodo saltans TaxID=75058 RepID=A0A0S4IT25_BODSA|nr:transmembrane protein, putative [Bodo saltans]|eukprot:CUF77031.1 transmembrane protein, putative [Bodo saltans]